MTAKPHHSLLYLIYAFSFYVFLSPAWNLTSIATTQDREVSETGSREFKYIISRVL